jgi:uncharacterized protein (DUF2141 family)
MSMVFRKIIILFIPLILLSCAQVGKLSGGIKDEIAPRPVAGKTFPPNETIGFTSNEVEITFDEFIQLNNPIQTIFFVPNHATPKAIIKNKTLSITWEETLKENTTYVIYMNGAIKDVTESNDSLMTYVFSTGNTIDSLSYSVTVADAWSNKPIKGATVGLFALNDSLKPYYFAKSDASGLATFSNLKEGTYNLAAFIDENLDMQIQASETVAFRSEPMELSASQIDTVPLLLSAPLGAKKTNSFTYNAPGSFTVASNYSLLNADFFMNNTKIEKENMHFFEEDSVALFYTPEAETKFELIVKGENVSDTLNLRITEKEKASALRLIPNFKNNQIGNHETVSFTVNDRIVTVDNYKIKLLNLKDSLAIPFETKIDMNKLTLDFDRKDISKIQVVFQKGAALGQQNTLSDSISLFLTLKEEKDYGIIHVDISQFKQNVIVELLQNNKVVQKVLNFDGSKVSFLNLEPGIYQFRVIEDLNANFKWDPGNRALNLQPEKVFNFTKPTTVRANWEIDVPLTPIQ